ncbi:DEAD/DEAH box helicase [Marinicella rhabdoformis]|uniref:DEAD/DEAH box helicase n=1 Tax=Marinicella rhabdoformis TaxID=2580566 RepID=UPI0012AEBDB6|nr:DEAD/DEAH box helicase [Marinicella rhabdoformis]
MFNHLIQQWFDQKFEQPTEVQKAAWREIDTGKDVLIAAPTGSGKTLAAFLSAINRLFIKPETEVLKVIYVSPLKALSNDIHLNLQQPLAEIQSLFSEKASASEIRAEVWTGDTTAYQREKIKKKPPHILVTTPESLYNIITSKAGRAMMGGIETVIIDEIHALAPNKRGAHLLLSLMRLEALTLKRPQRIAISATQRPIEKVRDYILHPEFSSIIDLGHKRDMVLQVVIPETPLEIIMSNEQWTEVYDALAKEINAHRTTVVFVNNRRLSERAAKHLAERVGDGLVTAHHGSLAKKHRLEAETALKNGQLKAIVATASLELGIDIGDVDLVCQIGSPGSIQAFLQRVGRSGHGVNRTPKGLLFPLTVDDLLEAEALMQAIAGDELEHIAFPDQPLDVLSQQIVAEVAGKSWPVKQLYHLFKSAYLYRNMTSSQFYQVIQMLADGFSKRATFQKALVFFDAVTDEVRARKSSMLTAVLNGGTIPDQFDYDVRLLPDDIKIGTLNEDFSFESLPGDIFQLGNHSYKILKVTTGTVFVEDANGQPPNIPFWFGVTMWRSDTLSEAVSRVRQQLQSHNESATKVGQLVKAMHIPERGVDQLINYALNTQNVLARMPSQSDIVVERFFDGNNDMHLVVHSVYGSRLNRAWGLALRKRFCKQFNFELQAAAIEDALILSLSSTHSFELASIKDYLNPETVKDVLIQALLDTPFFVTQWRWNASVALAVKRRNGSKRVLPQFQRNAAENLVAEVFPDQIACAENLAGNRTVPDHPLVWQTLWDCTQGIMDIEGLAELLSQIRSQEVNLHFVDSQTPSPASMAIINARNFAFLDEAPAEERRTLAIHTQGLNDSFMAQVLSPKEIERFNLSIQPQVRDTDELYEWISYCGVVWPDELKEHQLTIKDMLATGRLLPIRFHGETAYFTLSQQTHIYNVWPDAFEPFKKPAANDSLTAFEASLKELVMNRLSIFGALTEADLLKRLPVAASLMHQALLALEQQGVVFRFQDDYWIERHILARLRKTHLGQKRQLVKTISIEAYEQFLSVWQYKTEPLVGLEGVQAVLEMFQGFAATASEWEEEILQSRVANYDGLMLDQLCQSGAYLWKRAEIKSISSTLASSSLQKTKLTFLNVENAAFVAVDEDKLVLAPEASLVYELLKTKGALFFRDIKVQLSLLPITIEQCLIHLLKHGLIATDGFQAARVFSKSPAERTRQIQKAKRSMRRSPNPYGYLEMMGRWSVLPNGRFDYEQCIDWMLSRYGVLSYDIWQREKQPIKWSVAIRSLQRMEARGELLAGRFIEGMEGMQYALPEAYELIKKSETVAA